VLVEKYVRTARQPRLFEIVALENVRHIDLPKCQNLELLQTFNPSYFKRSLQPNGSIEPQNQHTLAPNSLPRINVFILIYYCTESQTVGSRLQRSLVSTADREY
jgi:hypothetical protein